MRGKHILKVTGSVALSALLAATSTMPLTIYAEEDDSNPTEKTETVYSVLNADGSVSDIVVSGWLHDEDGIKNLKEKLNLSDVRNVKTDEEPESSNGVYTWNADSNDVYYQGNATEKLPVSMKITYELDGQEVSENELAGKSGHLAIKIHLTNENSETRTINDKQVIIHPLFVAGGMMTLDTDHVSNVTCEQGKIVSDGSSQILAFAAVPGLKETLDSADLSKVSDELSVGDDITIECDITDYESTELMMGMSNEMSVDDVFDEVDSIDELTDGINDLMDADDQLVDGAKQLEDGTQQLITESQPLTSSSGSIRTLSNGAITLNDGAARLKAALAQYTGGVSQLNTGVNSLYAIPDGARQISSAITTSTPSQKSLTDGAAELTGGLQQMKSQVDAGLNTENVTAMMSQLETASAALDNLSTLLQNDYQVLNELETTLNAVTDQLNQTAAVPGSLNSYKAQLTVSAGVILTATETAKQTIDASIETLEGREMMTSDSETIVALKAQSKALATEKTVLQDTFNALNDTFTNVGTVVSGMTGVIADSKTKLEGLQNDITTSKATLTALQTQLSESQGSLEALGNMKDSLDNGLDLLIAGSQQIEAGIGQVNTAVSSLETQSKAGIDQVKAATTTLVNNNDALNSGIASLQSGTQTIANQSGSFNEMADGLDSLATAFETLHDGAKQLSDGQQQFKEEGLDQLKEKVDLSVDEIEMLKDIVDAIKDMNQQYREYAGDNENMDVTTRYVFRTQSEKKDD